LPVGLPAEQFVKQQRGSSCSSLPPSLLNHSGSSLNSTAGMQVAGWQPGAHAAAGGQQQLLLSGSNRWPTGAGQQQGGRSQFNPGPGCAAASGRAPLMIGRMPLAPPAPPPPPPRQPYLAGAAGPGAPPRQPYLQGPAGSAGPAGPGGAAGVQLQYNSNMQQQGMQMPPNQGMPFMMSANLQGPCTELSQFNSRAACPPASHIPQPQAAGGAAVFGGPAPGWGGACMWGTAAGGAGAGGGPAQGMYQAQGQMPGGHSMQGQWGSAAGGAAAGVPPAGAAAAAPWQISGAFNNVQGQWWSAGVPPAATAPEQTSGAISVQVQWASAGVPAAAAAPQPTGSSVSTHMAQMVGSRPKKNKKSAAGAGPSTTGARAGGAPVKQAGSKLVAAAQGRVPWYNLGRL
jgi:hypothetical protein